MQNPGDGWEEWNQADCILPSSHTGPLWGFQDGSFKDTNLSEGKGPHFTGPLTNIYSVGLWRALFNISCLFPIYIKAKFPMWKHAHMDLRRHKVAMLKLGGKSNRETVSFRAAVEKYNSKQSLSLQLFCLEHSCRVMLFSPVGWRH